jgi:hypothetical protein
MVYNKETSKLLEYYIKDLSLRILEVYSISQQRSTYFYIGNEGSFSHEEFNDFKTIKGWDITHLILQGNKDRKNLMKASEQDQILIKILNNSDLVYLEYK